MKMKFEKHVKIMKLNIAYTTILSLAIAMTIHAAEKETVAVRRFEIGPSFTLNFNNQTLLIGPRIDFGVRISEINIGINSIITWKKVIEDSVLTAYGSFGSFDIELGMEKDHSFIGGGASADFRLLQSISVPEIWFGFTLGIWVHDILKSLPESYFDPYQDRQWHVRYTQEIIRHIYFAGPRLKLQIPIRRLIVALRSTFLIGAGAFSNLSDISLLYTFGPIINSQ
jgi:hypothetical protein